MRIPGLHDTHRSLHDRHTDLDELAGDHERLAEGMTAVAVDQAGIFAVEVESLTDACVGK